MNFAGVVLWGVTKALAGVRRIEFHPARVPTRVRLVPAPTAHARADRPGPQPAGRRARGAGPARPSAGDDVIPIGRSAAIVLRYPMAQSPECPWTVGPAGPVDIRLDIPGDALVQAGTVAAAVDVLAGYLGGLLADTEVTVERQAMHRPPCDPDIVDDRLPGDGVVLRILRACARAGWRPDICATSRPDPVWHVPDAAAANKVRVKHRMGGYPSSSFWDEYRAVDARRVADEIAAGAAVTEPSWRTGTDEGRHARTAFTESRASRRRRSP